MLGEWLAAVLVLLLALYGCVCLIRRVCLWAVRCPRAVKCYRLAVPQTKTALPPLFRCLQAQAAWADSRTERTLVLLPNDEEEQPLLTRLAEMYPAVTVVTAQAVAAMAECEME